MKTARSILCILLVAATVLVFCACSRNGEEDEAPGTTGNPAEQTAAAKPEAEPAEKVESRADYVISNVDEYLNRPRELQPGSKVTLICSDVPSQLPWNCTPEGWLTYNCYEGLLYIHNGVVTDIRGCVAESWEHSEDYLTWTFRIRDGVKFADGTVCDAPAIAKSYDYYNEVSPATFSGLNMKSWEATSEKELIVHMSGPCAYLESALPRLYIVSPTAMETYGVNDNKAAVGTAPYYIESYTSGVGFTFKANPYYNFEEKMPCIETVRLNIINDENTRLMALLNGDIDGFQFSSVETYYNLKDNGFDGTFIQSYGNADPFWLNARKVPEFRIFEVRKAINRFLDMNAVNTLMFDDLGLVQDSLWCVGSSGSVPSDQFYYDEAEGLELMAAAGVDPNSMSFAAKIIDSGADLFVTIAGQLGKVGITMEIEPLEPEANFTFLMNGEWPITCGNSGYGDTYPYLPWTFILKPEHLIKECWQDIYDPGLYQKMLDEFDAMVNSLTWDDMLKHCTQLTKYCQDDFGAFPGIQRPWFAAYNKDLKSLVFSTENHYLLLYYMYKA